MIEIVTVGEAKSDVMWVSVHDGRLVMQVVSTSSLLLVLLVLGGIKDELLLVSVARLLRRRVNSS